MKTNDTKAWDASLALKHTHWSWQVRQLASHDPRQREILNEHWKHIPERYLTKSLKRGGQLFLTYTLLLPAVPERLPNPIRHELAHHPQQWVRKLVALNPGFTRNERVAALINTPLHQNVKLSPLGRTAQKRSKLNDMLRTLRGETDKNIEWDQLAPFTTQEANQLLRTPTWGTACSAGGFRQDGSGHRQPWHGHATSQPFLVWASATQNPHISGLTADQTRQAVTTQLTDLVETLDRTPDTDSVPARVLLETENWVQAVLDSPHLKDRNGDPLPTEFLSSVAWGSFNKRASQASLLKTGRPPRTVCVTDHRRNSGQVVAYRQLLHTMVGCFNIRKHAAPPAETKFPGNPIKSHSDLVGHENTYSDIFADPNSEYREHTIRYAAELMRTRSVYRTLTQMPGAVDLYCQTLNTERSITNQMLTAGAYSHCVAGTALADALTGSGANRFLLRSLHHGFEHGCNSLTLWDMEGVMDCTQNVEGRLSVLSDYLSGAFLLRSHPEETSSYLNSHYPHVNRRSVEKVAELHPEYTLNEILVLCT